MFQHDDKHGCGHTVRVRQWPPPKMAIPVAAQLPLPEPALLLLGEFLRPPTFMECSKWAIREAVFEKDMIRFANEFAESVEPYMSTVTPHRILSRGEMIDALGYTMKQLYARRGMDQYWWSNAQLQSRAASVLVTLFECATRPVIW